MIQNTITFVGVVDGQVVAFASPSSCRTVLSISLMSIPMLVAVASLGHFAEWSSGGRHPRPR
jgi:hypothetical protein